MICFVFGASYKNAVYHFVCICDFITLFCECQQQKLSLIHILGLDPRPEGTEVVTVAAEAVGVVLTVAVRIVLRESADGSVFTFVFGLIGSTSYFLNNSRVLFSKSL